MWSLTLETLVFGLSNHNYSDMKKDIIFTVRQERCQEHLLKLLWVHDFEVCTTMNTMFDSFRNKKVGLEDSGTRRTVVTIKFSPVIVGNFNVISHEVKAGEW